MISISGKKWVQQKINKNLVEKIKQDYDLADFLSNFVVNRNYDASEIFSINNNQKLTNIFINDSDFKKASSIVLKSLGQFHACCASYGHFDSAPVLFARLHHYFCGDATPRSCRLRR